ncbi:MAG: hypothetical protein M0Z53_09520 [Thermaerobacter sp.]|nr:hypothetical protein [Thermaerobacter sp.]
MKAPKSRPTPKRRPHRRLRPTGLGRLLIAATILSLLVFGHGVAWWSGYLLLGLVLVTLTRLTRGGSAWWAMLGLLGLAFAHDGLVPLWIAGIAEATAVIGLLRSLAASPRQPRTSLAHRRFSRWRGAPPTVRVAEQVDRPTRYRP